MTTRIKLSPAERRAILYAQDCVCPLCHGQVHPFGYFEVDHMTALGLGGEDGGDNLVAVHQTCHKAKTRTDIKAITKATRLAKAQGVHEEALRTGNRRPNAKERLRRKWDANRRLTLIAPRQE